MNYKQLKVALISSASTFLLTGICYKILSYFRQPKESTKEVPREKMIQILQQIKEKTIKRIPELRQQYFAQRYQYFQKDDKKYREVIQKYEEIMQNIQIKINEEVFADFGLNYSDFKVNFIKWYDDQKFYDEFSQFLMELSVQNFAKAEDLQYDEEKIENYLSYQVQRYDELYQQNKGGSIEHISYIDCLVNDECYQKFNITEAQLDTFGQIYSRRNPILQRYFMNRVSIGLIKYLKGVKV